MPDFPDAEAVLLDLLDGLDGAYTATALPSPEQFEALMPLVICNRIGGGTIDDITDKAMCSVLVIHHSRAQAWALAAKVREKILRAGRTPTAVNDVLIDATSEIVGNQEVMDINPDNRMVDSSYWLSFRRPLR